MGNEPTAATSARLEWEGLALGPTPLSADRVGIAIVDHGSRREASNRQLEEVVDLYRRLSGHPLVEPAHMELAPPTLADAFDRLVARGVDLVVVHPYFLGPGRHWHEDIPALAAAAAARHPGLHYLVTAPLGLDPRMADVVSSRIRDCLAQALGEGEPCVACAEGPPCRVDGGESAP